MSRIAVYPGTFDPITIGHADIVRRASTLFDTLIVALISQGSNKKVMFSSDKRKRMIELEIQRMDLSNVVVMIFDGLLVNFAKSNNASVIIRGLRAVSDFDYEFQMSWINSRMIPEIETIFLPASKEAQLVSSSMVKEIAKLGGNIDAFVSPEVRDMLNDFFIKSVADAL